MNCSPVFVSALDTWMPGHPKPNYLCHFLQCRYYTSFFRKWSVKTGNWFSSHRTNIILFPSGAVPDAAPHGHHRRFWYEILYMYTLEQEKYSSTFLFGAKASLMLRVLLALTTLGSRIMASKVADGIVALVRPWIGRQRLFNFRFLIRLEEKFPKLAFINDGILFSIQFEITLSAKIN
jgi:hypothetical protein